MGLIISLLTKKKIEDVFIDFEAAEPTDKELRIYDSVNNTLLRGQAILQEIRDYTGAQEPARKAMANATPENEEAAFAALMECVDSIKRFYDFAKELEQVVPPLLKSLATPPEGENKEEKRQPSLPDQQALARQLAEVFDFTLQFDQIRMTRPFLSNDFSYYRRLLPKFAKQPYVKVKEDDANGMAMFTAQHIPMMKSISVATAEQIREDPNIIDALVAMAHACLSMIRSKKFEPKSKWNLLCARAMTGSIVLYDHVDPLGVFAKKCPIDVKECITVLKRDFPDQPALLNAIHFSTVTFKNAPNNIQILFDQ